MSDLKTSLSKKNPYYLSKYRYLELKNFCLQFDDWTRDYNYLAFINSKSESIIEARLRNGSKYSRTEAIAILRNEYFNKILLVTDTVKKACDGYSNTEVQFLLEGVTTGLSYDKMIAQGKFCAFTRHEYYDRYRWFFWELDKYQGLVMTNRAKNVE